VAHGTIRAVPKDDAVEGPSRVLVSNTGVALSRPTTFRFTLDPTRAQRQRLLAHACAAGWHTTTSSAGSRLTLGSGPRNAPPGVEWLRTQTLALSSNGVRSFSDS
jgi:hypothetical protein